MSLQFSRLCSQKNAFICSTLVARGPTAAKSRTPTHPYCTAIRTYNTGRRVDSTDYARACLDNDTPNVSVYKHGRYSSCQLMRRLCDRIADEAGKKRESVVESSLFPSLIFLAPRRLLYISLYILCYMCVSGLFVLVFDS